MKRKTIKDLPITGLISSYNPTWALLETVESMFKGGASVVIVVDDGSPKPDAAAIFEAVEALGAKVIHPGKNVGKASALKSGFPHVPVGSVIAQSDDDTLVGNLLIPMRLIARNKADIVDIRVETNHTKSLLGLIQELDYWMINAVIKRLQHWFRARLWMSGASAMYSYEAGKVLLMVQALTITEDTEGMFRAREHGLRVIFLSKKEAQFITMVPETFKGLRRQWKRWAQGNGQVIGLYGLGGRLKRVTLMNCFAWIALVILPVLAIIVSGIIPTLEWLAGFSLVISIIGAICLRRFAVILVFWLLPIISYVWIFHALEGIIIAIKEPICPEDLTWESPERTSFQ